METRLTCSQQPNVAYAGIARIEYGRHPFSPSAFRGTPAEDLPEGVTGPDRMAWLAVDWYGNVVGVEEAGWLDCPYLPGAVIDGRVVEEVVLVPDHDQDIHPGRWVWEVGFEAMP